MADRKFRPCWFLSLALLAVPAPAAEWLSGGQLARHCDALLDDTRDGEAALCVTFVQGYLAGVEAVDRLAATYGTAEPQPGDRETFRERAARTRVGSYIDGRPVPRARPRYCLPEDADARHVVEQISRDLRERRGEPDLTAAQAVHRALVRNFPCEDG